MRPLDPRLRPHLAPARRALTLVVAGSLAGGLLSVAQAFSVGSLIVALVQDPAGASWHPAAWWLAILTLLRALTGYIVDVSASKAAGQVSTALRQRVVSAAVRMEATELSRHRTGELTLLGTRGMAAIEPYLTRYLPSMVAAAALPMATLATILWLDWVSGLIVAVTLPLMPVFAVLIGMTTRDRAARQWRELGALSGHFLDIVRGLPTLVAHRRAEAQGASIRSITERYRRATHDTLRLAFASSAVLELIATLSVALVAVSVGLRLASGSLDFRTALIVLLLAPEAFWPIRRVGAEYHAAAEGVASFGSATALLEVAGTPASGVALPTPGPVPIRLVDLCVGYQGRGVLQGVDTVIAGPGLTAVTGPSGCGKSTLLAALLGELPVMSGAIRVGEVDLRDLDADSWRGQLAWAPQRPWLTAGSIAENVRIGRPEATDVEVWRALERVALDEVVASLPQGMDTALGEDGAGLSAGQRSRVALARVVLARRPFVLLDEPTAHLDEVTEAVFLDTLRWLSRDATVIVVAHREAIVNTADHVLTLPAVSAVPRALAGVPAASGAIPVRGSRQQGRSSVVPVAPTPSQGRFGRRTGILLGVLSVASGVALTATAAWLITRASQHPPVLTLMVAIVAVRTFGLARPVLRYAERLVSHDAALRLLAERRAQVYDALVPLVPGRLGIRRGDLLASIVDDVDALVDRELRVRQPLWTAALVGSATALMAALVSPRAGLGVAFALVLCAFGVLVARVGAGRTEPEFVRARAIVSTRVEEIVHSARQLELWQITQGALEELDDLGRRLARAADRTARALAAGRALALLGGGSGLIAMALLVPVGATSPAILALLVLLPLALADALSPAIDAAGLSVRTSSAQARIDRLGARIPAVTSPQRPNALNHLGNEVVARDVRGGWGEADAIRGVTFALSPGSWIGVVGPSGSGKSTLTALLLRFLDPRAGSLTLDQQPLDTLALADLRGVVGLVDDDPYIFGSSVAENVRLARPDADDPQVEQALRAAHLGDWIDSLPEGLGTMIGEGNAVVSGGERARIGIARCLLADQPVLVLDEPTAHLDSSTARALTSDLLEASTGRSLVWITHGTIGLDAMTEVIDLGNTATEPPTAADVSGFPALVR